MTDSLKEFETYVNFTYRSPTLTDIEIAKILGVHRETIYRMRKKGQGPNFFKVGKKVLCLKQDFFEWFFSQYYKI